MAQKVVQKVVHYVDGKTHCFDWVSKPVSREYFQQLRAIVLRTTNYGLPDEAERAEIKSLTNIWRIDGRCAITNDQVNNLRSLVVKSKIFSRCEQIDEKIADIRKFYDGGEPIMSIAHRLDYPPLSLLRRIFKKQYAHDVIHDVFTHRIGCSKKFDARDCVEFFEAEANDLQAIDLEHSTSVQAAEDERAFVSYLKSLGIGLKTQEQTSADQMRVEGRAIATPDVLFESPIKINGEPIAWIDYKGYCGIDLPPTFRHTTLQTGKYFVRWGKGAICYKFGFVEGFSFPNTILLSEIGLEK